LTEEQHRTKSNRQKRAAGRRSGCQKERLAKANQAERAAGIKSSREKKRLAKIAGGRRAARKKISKDRKSSRKKSRLAKGVAVIWRSWQKSFKPKSIS